ncbi:hypothetical protein [Terrabacter sp. Soil810]|uniref:hypothetical protein n=1 Tax=Terrabacter sp. Soil810 TaxID=1736418 RepID=UPI00070E3E51|nr:hypothetical protein [Terrabacter sp. Soil810]KRF38398.1 hypothetical protein ASG96_18370 [Terrabacter sp. Soil810]
MSVDERLRIGLARNAQVCNPEVELLLEAALARGRRDRRLRWAWVTAGVVAAACTALVLALSLGWRSDRGAPLVPADGATSTAALQGRYAADVPAQQSAPGVAGRWVLEFQPQGVLAVTSPPAYPGVVSGVLYAVVGEELRTDLFSQDLCSGQPLGRYLMTRRSARLTLTLAVDPCPQRVAVLTTTSWTALP